MNKELFIYLYIDQHETSFIMITSQKNSFWYFQNYTKLELNANRRDELKIEKGKKVLL